MSTTVSAQPLFAAAGVNRATHCAAFAPLPPQTLGKTRKEVAPSPGSLLAYGAGQNVVVAGDISYSAGEDDLKEVNGTVVPLVLTGHTSRVDCICWLAPDAGLLGHLAQQEEETDRDSVVERLFRQFSDSPLLVSGAADGCVRVWRIRSQPLDSHEPPWESVVKLNVLESGGAEENQFVSKSRPYDELARASLQDSQSASSTPCVCAVASIMICRSCCDQKSSEAAGCSVESILVASDTDGRVAVFVSPASKGGSQWQLRERIPMPAPNKGGVPNVQETVALSRLPGTQIPMLAVAGTHRDVLVFVETGTQRFVLAAVLSGHQEWVQSLSFSDPLCLSLDSTGVSKQDPSTLLASASQDSILRLWRVQEICDGEQNDSAPASGAVGDELVRSRGHVLKLAGRLFRINLYAVLAGHEDWVQSACWAPAIRRKDAGGEMICQPLILLTASMDRSMILWSPDGAAALPGESPDQERAAWHPHVSVGATSREEGLFGGLLSPCGQFLLGYGYAGSFHLWRSGTADASCGSALSWVRCATISGHQRSVSDCAWLEVDKRPQPFVLATVSADQTTRLWGSWLDGSSWHELSRPQVHGFDLSGVCAPPLSSKKPTLLSSADEKVIRVFEVPEAVLHSISDQPDSSTEVRHTVGATLPPLGLSNKPVVMDSKNTALTTTADLSSEKSEEERLLLSKEAPQPQFLVGDGGAQGVGEGLVNALSSAMQEYSQTREPPVEETLAQLTLWPETGKLYGHQNEVGVLECSNNGKLVVSACKALGQNAQLHAALVLHSTDTWLGVGDSVSTDTPDRVSRGMLFGHGLSVQQVTFSPHDDWLVSISRDRTLCVWRLSWEDGHLEKVSLAAREEKCHARVVHSCSFSAGGLEFATGGRDKVAKVWTLPGDDDGKITSRLLAKTETSVTAVAFHSTRESVCALGLEDGTLLLYSATAGKGTTQVLEPTRPGRRSRPQATGVLLLRFPQWLCHSQAINRIRWAPARSCTGRCTAGGSDRKPCSCDVFATASEDNLVRTLRLRFE